MPSRYKDISFGFKSHPLTGDIMTAVDTTAINQSIKNILLTNVGEYPFSDFGSFLNTKLFDLFTPELKREIEDEILGKLVKYEPRIIVNDVTVEEFKEDYSLQIVIRYEIRTVDDEVTFSMFLRRA